MLHKFINYAGLHLAKMSVRAHNLRIAEQSNELPQRDSIWAAMIVWWMPRKNISTLLCYYHNYCTQL